MGDDFSEPVKRVLATRVGNVCSNPECRALTSGPQENPAKALNIGVAAHITAASVGGPRYDPQLLPEERSSPSNGIWLCQNCAKLVDNDPTRFTIELLQRWKSSAESEARERIGKTAAANTSPSLGLKLNDRVRIAPTIPRSAEQAEWLIIGESERSFLFHKSDSGVRVEIPASFIEKVHRFAGTTPALVQLAGRLQWNSVNQRWQLMPEKPDSGPRGQHGFSKYVDFDYPRNMNYVGGFAWCREDHLAQCLRRGRYVFYDADGNYLRVGGPDIDQILVSDRP
jgi:hypothetical protein